MRHGDEIQVLLDGPSIRLNSLDAIGISSDSQCWGVWIDRRYRLGDEFDENEPHDFVISPIHPDLWPFVFRVEAAMRPQPGTLYRLSRELTNNGVNILFLDHALGGYSHSVCNAICMFEKNQALADIFVNFQKEFQSAVLASIEKPRAFDISELRTRHFRELGEHMIGQLAGLWANIRSVEHKMYQEERALERARSRVPRNPIQDPLHFLSPRVVEQGLEPWFSRILDHDENLIPFDEEVEDFPPKVKLLSKRNRKLLESVFDRDYVGNTDGRRQTLRDLLGGLRESHMKTRYSQGHKDTEFTVQATIAHMEPIKWFSHILRRFTWRHTHLPLAVQALVRLAEMRFWMAPYDPVEFKYDAEQRTLKPTNHTRFAEQVRQLGKCGPLSTYTPTWALASYNHEDRFVRLRFIRNSGNDCVRLEITYEIEGVPTVDIRFSLSVPREDRSKGLLMHITRVIAEQHGNILRASNSVDSFNPHTGSEKGNLRFTVQFPKSLTDGDRQELEERLRSAVQLVLNGTPSNPTEIPSKHNIKIVKFQRERLFVSTVLSLRRNLEIGRILKSVAQKYGLEVRYALTNTDGVRQNVHREIASCRYFLQIVTPRSDEFDEMKDNPNYIPDFSWLTFEYGCATALTQVDSRRRCIQMVDEFMSRAAQDRLRNIGGDTQPIGFRVDDSVDGLRAAFESAITELLRDNP